jgi:hypothetical protein
MPYSDKYVGDWKEDRMSVHGEETHADGSKYVGEWKEGKQNGRGEYTYPDGAKYVGELREGENRMDMVKKYTLMLPNMLVSGERGKKVDMVDSIIRMEMCTAVSGRMVSLSRAGSPKMVKPGMVVVLTYCLDYRQCAIIGCIFYVTFINISIYIIVTFNVNKKM